MFEWIKIALAMAAVFFLSDFIYALDHYLVHFDKKRYPSTHGRHHVRYGGVKDAYQLNRYELTTYGTAAFMSLMPTSVVTLFTGNPGFFLGALFKFAHTLLFHLYQHKWWGDRPASKLGLGKPNRTWFFASARYHAWHHTHPNDEVFTYSESWAGFDRILEWAHPWLYHYTVDGAAEQKKSGAATIETRTKDDVQTSQATENRKNEKPSAKPQKRMRRPGSINWIGTTRVSLAAGLGGCAIGFVTFERLAAYNLELPWIVGLFAGVLAGLASPNKNVMRGLMFATFAVWIAAAAQMCRLRPDLSVPAGLATFHDNLSLLQVGSFILCALLATGFGSGLFLGPISRHAAAARQWLWVGR